jgi:uncharacterized integral membrane protein
MDTNQIDQKETPRPDSNLGGYSIIIAIVSGCLLLLILAVLAIVKESSTELSDPAADFISALAFLALIASFVGVVLGIISVRQNKTKRTQAILGMFINGAISLDGFAFYAREHRLKELLANIVVAYAYTLPSLAIGGAIVYFAYAKPSKLSLKVVYFRFSMAWSLYALPILLFGQKNFGNFYFVAPIVIGCILSYMFYPAIGGDSR